MKPTSDARRAENAVRWERLEEKFGPRDEWVCQFLAHRLSHPEVRVKKDHRECFGPIHGHEILKRSRGGSITDMRNVTLLCQYHNGWVENHPYVAHELGLAKHAWEIDVNDILYGTEGPQL